MATITKRTQGSWQAKVRRKGYPAQCRTFTNRSDAVRWATALEAELARGVFADARAAERMTVREALSQFRSEVVPLRRGQSSDPYRIATLDRHLGSFALAYLQPKDVAAYRDKRLHEVGPQAVLHELKLLNRVYTWLVHDKGLPLPGKPPTARIAKPKPPRGRERRVSQQEIDAIVSETESAELGAIVRLAVATAMRRGEIVGLRWENIDFDRRTALLPTTKNGEPRRAPLSPDAIAVFEQLPRRPSGSVFGMTGRSVHQAFQRASERARKRFLEGERGEVAGKSNNFLEGLHFHDLRHEATSRLFERGDLNLMEVALITGHKDLRMLQRYTHLRPESISMKLASSSPPTP
jgi:integrase